MVTDIRNRLASLGVGDIDTLLVEITARMVTDTIKNECNTSAVPDGLKNVAADMGAGEYLFKKKNSGQLAGFDLETAVKRIDEGDTSITFAFGEGSATPEQRLDALIAFLMNRGKREFVRFRCVAW